MKLDATVVEFFASSQGIMPTIAVVMRMYSTATMTIESTIDRGIVFVGFVISSPMLQTWL